MAINILGIQPSVVSRDLKGKFVAIVGQAKSGKTSLAVQFPKNLLCGFEHGWNALSNVMGVDILKWKDFKDVVKQLETPEAQAMYDTVTIDTVSIAWKQCNEYICAREGVDKISEIPFGGGYSMVEDEFDKMVRKITQLGYGIVLICHDKSRIESDGSNMTTVYYTPDIPTRCDKIVNRLVDIIAYIYKDTDGNRSLYTRQSRFVEGNQIIDIQAGSRFAYLKSKIKLGYQDLVDAIADAIDEEAKNGGKVVDTPVVVPVDDEIIDFKSLKSGIGKIAKALVKLDEELEEPHYMNDYKKIVEQTLGKNKLVKDCDETQADHLSLILEDLQDYVATNNINI